MQLLEKGMNGWRFSVFVLVIGLGSLWVRAAFPVVAIAAPHDDFLFVTLANSILEGRWLGTYNNLTHAKGAMYPLFIAAVHWVGLPLKLTEQMVYLTAALHFSLAIGRLHHSRWVMAVLFLALAFNPTAWSPVVGGRIIRENLYTSQVLLLFSLAIRCFLERDGKTIKEELPNKLFSLLALGLVGGAFWLTREEGIWLLPAMGIFVGYWLLTRWNHLSKSAWAAVLYPSIPVSAMIFVIFTINLINYSHYAVFRNNDFRSPDFVGAYGALSRIKHAHWQRYVVFPKDARALSYEFSPAAKALQPSFEGDLGEAWRFISCSQTRIDPCPEILSGWFMWAFRDAVQATGHYDSATNASDYYRRLADEINSACRSRPDQCLPERQSLIPYWQETYFRDTLKASFDILKTLSTLYGLPIEKGTNFGSTEQLAIIQRITNEIIDQSSTCQYVSCTDSNVSLAPVRHELARIIAKAQRFLLSVGFPLALIWFFSLSVFCIFRRDMKETTVVVLSVATAICTRVIILGFLEATSIPSNNMLYLSPVVPLALALTIMALFGIAGVGFRHEASGKRSL